MGFCVRSLLQHTAFAAPSCLYTLHFHVVFSLALQTVSMFMHFCSISCPSVCCLCCIKSQWVRDLTVRKSTTVIQTVAAACHNCLSVLLSFCLAPMQDIFGPSFKLAWPSLSVSCESYLPTWDMAACRHFLTSPEPLRPFFDDSVAVSYSSLHLDLV